MSWYYRDPWHERARDTLQRWWWCKIAQRHRWSMSGICKRCGKRQYG